MTPTADDVTVTVLTRGMPASGPSLKRPPLRNYRVSSVRLVDVIAAARGLRNRESRMCSKPERSLA
jgi:hypothetical protein